MVAGGDDERMARRRRFDDDLDSRPQTPRGDDDFCLQIGILGESKVDGWTLKNRIVKDEPETNQGWWGLGLGVYGHGLGEL
ncbi:unnamed protein product [Cuscuta campestris]|uniref:Uncharacterized protein n=1 Tax=Cuscuta campestris TaxID=132261 RepID=A0A484M0C6_9ASTE|nr:unnamed protein product [Cuscuta campestris]